MLEIKIEHLKKNDLDGVLEIEKKAFSNPWTREMFERELSLSFSHLFVAWSKKMGEEILGYVGFWQIIDEAHIINLAVNPDFRRCGVGEQLISYITDITQIVGVERFFLEVRVSNLAALKLYEKAGFKCVALRKKYYPDNNEDAYVMCRDKNIKVVSNIKGE